MENDKKSLKLYGILFIILAIFDVIYLGVNFFYGDFKDMFNANIEGISTDLLNAVLIILLVIMGIITLIKLFLGIRAIKQSNGTCKGTSHIYIAKVALFFVIVTVVGSLFELKLEFSSIENLLDDIITITILFDYIKVSKNLLNN